MRGIWPIFALAFLWAITGSLAGLGIASVYGVDWIVECGSLNVAIGMIMLQIVTRNESARRLLYEGKRERDQLNLGIAFLWGLPFAMATLGIVWWLLGKVLPPS